MTDPRIEAAINAVLQARRWRDKTWGDGAIGGFDYSTDEKKRYVIRDHSTEEREGKTVILYETDDHDAYQREFERVGYRREITAALKAADAAAWRPIESAPRDGRWFLTYTPIYYGIRVGKAHIRADHDDWLSHIDARNGGSWKGGRKTHPLDAAARASNGRNAMTDRESHALEGMSTRTVRIEKTVPGYVDITAPTFMIRLTDDQAIEFAMSIMGQAARIVAPTTETEND